MSLKAAVKHLMGFIYLQPPSDVGDILPVDVLFLWDTHLAFRKMTPVCIFCDGGEETFVTDGVKSGGEMLPLCLVTVRYLQSDHMTGAAPAKSHGHCLQARCKGHVALVVMEWGWRLHSGSLVCFGASGRDAHHLHIYIAQQTCYWPHLHDRVAAYSVRCLRVCLCNSCFCSFAWNMHSL